MRKYLLSAFLFPILFSCSTDETINNDCYAKSTILQKRIDSLETVLSDLKGKEVVAKPIAKKGKKKKGNQRQELQESSLPLVSTDPPVSTTRLRSSSNDYSGQCMATTKKGTRCSRNARSGGYCWQHGG